MKPFFIFGLILISIASLFAQKDTTFWNKKLETGLNINQSSFNEQWTATQGGVDNVAFTAFLFAKSEYVQFRSSVINDLQLQFGKSSSEAFLIPTWRKNLDRIFIDNKYGYAFSGKWSLFASVLFQSQFAAGNKFEKFKGDSNKTKFGESRDSVTKISSFLAPGVLDEALGLEYKPTTYLSLRLGLVALRQTFMIDEAVIENTKKFDEKENSFTAQGVRQGTQIRNQLGYNAVLKFDKDVAKNINLKIIGQYFSSYDNLAVGVSRWDAIFTAKVSKFINVNLTGVFIYNQDQVARIQSNQALALGVVYKVGNQK